MSEIEFIEEGDALRDLTFFDLWLNQLTQKKSIEECVELFMKEASRFLQGAPIIFFKYIPHRSSLVVSQVEGVRLDELRGVGFELASSDGMTVSEQLNQPYGISDLHDLVIQALPKQSYVACPLVSNDLCLGVFAIFNEVEAGENGKLTNPYIRSCVRSLSQMCQLLSLESKMHQYSIFDKVTGTFNKDGLIQNLRDEISRSRRTQLPVSFAIVKLNPVEELSQLKEHDLNFIVRNVGKIINKNSRVNDILGRLSATEFGFIMPHTPKLGAAIKCEKLRKMIQTADFLSQLKAGKNITVSVGVSEYPSICNDADELLRTADEALLQISQITNNKVCIATERENFNPDFVLSEK